MTRQLMMVTLGMAALLATGCEPGKYAGGGWLPSANPEATRPEDRATFVFVAKGEDTDGDGEADTAKGQFQYHDRGMDVHIHGVVDAGGSIPVRVSFEVGGPFSDFVGLAGGTYEPQPRSLGEGGTFEVVLFTFDASTTASTGQRDFVQIAFFGGIYDGYSNQQFLESGNVGLLPLGND